MIRSHLISVIVWVALGSQNLRKIFYMMLKMLSLWRTFLTWLRHLLKCLSPSCCLGQRKRACISKVAIYAQTASNSFKHWVSLKATMVMLNAYVWSYVLEKVHVQRTWVCYNFLSWRLLNNLRVYRIFSPLRDLWLVMTYSGMGLQFKDVQINHKKVNNL